MSVAARYMFVGALILTASAALGQANVYDGTYRGVSFRNGNSVPNNGYSACAPVNNPSAVPQDLTISGGTATLPYRQALGRQVTFRGPVGADGTGHLRNEPGDIMLIHVDKGGTASGTLTYGNGCSYLFSWKK